MRDADLCVSAIGGSEIAAILGFPDWRDRLSVWALKRGHLSPAPPTPQMILGKVFEEALIMRWYAPQTGYRVEWCDQTSRFAGRPFMAATPDAMCPDERRGVDAKMVFWDRAGEWGEEIDAVPVRVDLQCRWYMSAFDYPLWDVAAVINGQPRIYTIERDLEIENEILCQAEAFWRRYLVGDEEPPIGTSEDSKRYLQERYPTHGQQLRPATPEEAGLLAEYAQVRDEERAMQVEKTLCENRLKHLVGEDAGITAPGYRFTWKRSKDKQIVDWETIARLGMKDLSEEQIQKVAAEFSHIEPGPRRIYFYQGKEKS